MKKVNGLLILFIIGCVLSISSAIVLFSEHKGISDIYASQSRLGHEMVEVRDEVTLGSIDNIRAPYDLNYRIVELMKRVRELALQYNDQNSRLMIFKNEAQNTINQFHDSALEVSLTLESLVGVIVARESVLSSLGARDDSRRYIINQFVSHNLVSEGNADQQNFTYILTDLLSQQKTYLSILLSYENVDFVEIGEHRLLDLANTARDLSVLSIFFSFIFISGIGGVVAYQRKQELIEKSRVYKESAEKTKVAANAKSLFLATMSHELRTPMNGVLGIAQIIADSTKEVETKRHVNTLMESGEHLVTILNDILDFSKTEQGKMKLEASIFSFSTIIDSIEAALRPLATKKAITLHFVNQIACNAQVEGDPARVRQILFNLIGNAVKFTQQGGVTVSFDVDRGGIKIKITDTGVGIERERLDMIFNPFEQADLSTTRKFGGTGLGLSIVKQLVDKMGGEIDVFSQVNVGTEFTISLPLKITYLPQENRAESEVKPVQVLSKKIPLKVLIAEDNKVNALVLKKMCESDGHKVLCVDDGLKAIEELKQNTYHLVLMDNHMPRLGGVEAIKIIRQELGLSICIFACTADVFKEAHEEFINAGANFVLTKPLQLSSLKKAIISKQALIMENSVSSNNNVVCISRLPSTDLPLTEEELSKSEIVNSDLEDDLKYEILQTFISEIDNNIDIIIKGTANSSTSEVFEALHSIKGVALDLGLKYVATLSASSEAVARAGSMPSLDELQVLVNLLLVNTHQAERILSSRENKERQGGANAKG